MALGLEIDDEGNFYDPLSKDLDNDGIADRYEMCIRDSPYTVKLEFSLNVLKYQS